VAHKFSFQLTSDDRRRPLPHKILIGLGVNESIRHVAIKFLGWLLFFRERLQIDTDVQNDSIPFVPDLVELGYDMRPKLWVECGECSPAKLHKIAVKCPEAEIWVLKSSPEEAQALLHTMAKEEFRRGRYGIVALDPEMFDEFCRLMAERNTFHWYRGELDQGSMQFDLNGLWFDTAFEVFRH
jgi:uncharacterized protein YaeQ